MSAPGKAVFLSYASQDAEAAKRICTALRAAGVEVWFDQSELVGGDQWDAKIRRQIKDCALFVPVISANTQARLEGYFRLEWKLAAQRTQTMAEAKPFLLPVVIDETGDAAAHVPEEFRAVHWTRIGSADSLSAFGERVTKLLDGGSAVGRGRRTPPLGEPATGPRPPGAPTKPTGFGDPALQTKRETRTWAWAALAVVAVGLGFAFFLLRHTPAQSSVPLAAPPPSDFAAAKSVAVLAFQDMSAGKDAEYFSDGISEELLNMLAKVPGLKVAARTSAFHFKGKDTPIPEIAKQLGVAYVVEGSVRKAGEKVRVTAQLIKAADGFHVWSDNFDRDLKDIFAVQDEIARVIVAKLQITLTGSTGLPAAKRGTENVEAYALYLKGKFHLEKRTEPDLRQAMTHFEAALARQPDYALAYAGLASVYGYIRFWAYESPGSVTPQFRAAVAKALELDDTLSEAHATLAALRFYVDWDWSMAEQEYQRALELNPANVDAHALYAHVLSVTGRHPEAIAKATKTQQLDPLSITAKGRASLSYLFAGDTDHVLEVAQEAIAMAPDYFLTHQSKGIALYWKGEREAGLMAMERAAQLGNIPDVLGRLGRMYGWMGRKAEAQKILERLLTRAKEHYVPAAAIANVHEGLGDFEQANVWMNRAIEDRESSLVYLKCFADEVTRANPYYAEWLRKIGLPK